MEFGVFGDSVIFGQLTLSVDMTRCSHRYRTVFHSCCSFWQWHKVLNWDLLLTVPRSHLQTNFNWEDSHLPQADDKAYCKYYKLYNLTPSLCELSQAFWKLEARLTLLSLCSPTYKGGMSGLYMCLKTKLLRNVATCGPAHLRMQPEGSNLTNIGPLSPSFVIWTAITLPRPLNHELSFVSDLYLKHLYN